MVAPRNRGAFATIALGLLALASACSNGTEPKKDLCNSSSALSLSGGEVKTPLDASCVFVSGGSTGGEFAIVAFNADTDSVRTASVNFTSQGAGVVSTPLQSRTFAQAPLLNLMPGETNASIPSRSNTFELKLRNSERRVLPPLMSSARTWYRSSTGGLRSRFSPSFSASAAGPSVGDTLVLNTNTGDSFQAACQIADNRTGVVQAISNNAIVVADTGNPAGGYTVTEYQTIGAQFDTVFAMDTTAFGSATDIDNNGKIIMFFTRAVNELTPQNAPNGVVGGFFYGRDLFPRQAAGGLEACPTSNVAEMFYLLVPDPNGVVNMNKFSHSMVQHLTNSTTAHEFQHLINASRRLYINTAATDFEVTWLNEGLSHVAEELLFYKQSAGPLAPRMDLDSTDFKTNQTNVDSYNFNQASNFGRFRAYILKPSASSPYARDDELETRGATWSFLRYAADHHGTSDGTTWKQLVNSTTNGFANLQNVFGANLPSIFNDWSVTTIADNVSGATNPEWQEQSWNYRAIFDYLTRLNPVPAYPLATVTVGDNSPLAVTLKGGGTAYVRFTIGANQTGSVKWTTQATGVTMSIVRLK